jgi:hypothetical protein
MSDPRWTSGTNVFVVFDGQNVIKSHDLDQRYRLFAYNTSTLLKYGTRAADRALASHQGIQKSNPALRKIPIVGRDARTIDRSEAAGYDGTEGAGQEPEV